MSGAHIHHPERTEAERTSKTSEAERTTENTLFGNRQVQTNTPLEAGNTRVERTNIEPVERTNTTARNRRVESKFAAGNTEFDIVVESNTAG